MNGPPALLEQIKQAYKVNCRTIDDICNSKGATNIDIEIDPKTNRVKEIRKCKVEKSAITSVTKACSFVPFPYNPFIAPKNLAESVCTFDQIVEINTQLVKQAQECDQILKGEFGDKCMKVIRENICALQPPLQEYHGALYAFDPDQAITEVQSLFNQLGQNYSIKFAVNEKEKVFASNEKHDVRVISPKGNCDLCGDHKDRRWIHFCCAKIVCIKCKCKCSLFFHKEIGQQCGDSICFKKSAGVCFTCKKILCNDHICH